MRIHSVKALLHLARRAPALLMAAWLQRRASLPSLPLPPSAFDLEGLPPPILEDVGLPPYYWSHDHDDYAPLMRLAAHRQPKVVVELGTAFGNLTANLCQLLPNASIFTVNALEADQTGSAISYKLNQAEIGRVYKRLGYADRVQQIYANTLHLDLQPHLAGRLIDLAIIDACHDTRYVINDFEIIYPYLSPSGVIMLHDTDPDLGKHVKNIRQNGHLTGSLIACMVLRQRGFDIRHLAGTWWAVWSRQPVFGSPLS